MTVEEYEERVRTIRKQVRFLMYLTALMEEAAGPVVDGFWGPAQ